MKKNYSFVNIIVPQEQYVEKREYDGMTIVLLDATKDGDMYRCVECSVPTSEYDASEVLEAYKAWKAKMEVMRLRQAKGAKIAEIEAYDTSSSVNGFKLNGMVVWLDKATRVGLMNSTTIAKDMGNKTTDLWLNGYHLTVDCDKAIALLSALEMYALECFNVTASHKKAVEGMDSIEEVEKFDVTDGYPTQLEMSV